MKKADIVNLLARKRGYRSYLEIATPNSGFTYGEVDRAQLDCQRLLYRCPDDFSDGLPIEFRTAVESSAELVRTLLDNKTGHVSYDAVFVDSFHVYRTSMEDILGGYCLTRPGGMLVVHDCNPPHEGLVDPAYRPGYWCGVSFQAFVDFVLPREHLNFFTVDCDYGCGVIFKPEDADAARDRLALDWYCARRDDMGAFSYFQRHPLELLQLKSVRQFVSEHELTWSPMKSAVAETVRALSGRMRR